MKFSHQIAGYSTFLFLFFISGCGPILNPYNENFNCRAKDDAGECIDTPTAYQKARFPEPSSEEKLETIANPQLELQDNRYKLISELLEEEKKPILQPPKILRVLMLPYKGEGDELFMSRYVYLKVDESQWILTDLVEE